LDNAKARINPPIPPPLRSGKINQEGRIWVEKKNEPNGDVELAGWF
jgi:hypothetical protein